MHGTIKHQYQKAASVIEYVIVVMVVMLAIITMFPYIRNVFTGQYRKAGESFGFLRQYDPTNTRECVQDGDGKWYSSRCFANKKNKDACRLPCQGIGE